MGTVLEPDIFRGRSGDDALGEADESCVAVGVVGSGGGKEPVAPVDCAMLGTEAEPGRIPPADPEPPPEQALIKLAVMLHSKTLSIRHVKAVGIEPSSINMVRHLPVLMFSAENA